MATCSGYGPGGCKTKYTGSKGSPARCQGVGCADKWQIQKQKPAYGPAFFYFKQDSRGYLIERKQVIHRIVHKEL